MRRLNNLEATKDKKIPAYFIVNEYDPRISLHRSFVAQMEQSFPDRVLQSKLHNRIAYSEVTHQGRGVFEYSDSKAKDEIYALVNELSQIISKL